MPFTRDPKWYIGESELQIRENMTYLGAIVGNDSGSAHALSRVKSCQKSFYSLQSAGLCRNGLDIKAAMHVWSATCKATLLYGCEALSLSHKDKIQLDKIQAKLLKCIVGIGCRYHSTPLLNALGQIKISLLVDVNSMFLLRNIMGNNSAASQFYHLMLQRNIDIPSLLCNRARNVCKSHSMNFIKFLCDSSYSLSCKRRLLHKVPDNQNGKIDTIRMLLGTSDNQTNLDLLRLLLKS
jgi:hypothetical protein